MPIFIFVYKSYGCVGIKRTLQDLRRHFYALVADFCRLLVTAWTSIEGKANSLRLVVPGWPKWNQRVK